MTPTKQAIIDIMLAMAHLPAQKISLCALAKFCYSGRYPQLCALSPLAINQIAKWAEGQDGSRDEIISVAGISASDAARSLGQRGGAAKTPAQQAAARENGKKGGWPKGRKRK